MPAAKRPGGSGERVQDHLPAGTPDQCECCDVNLANIAIAHNTFQCRLEPNVSKIAKGLAAVGQQAPVDLTRDKPHPVLDGFRRCEAARALGWTTITAIVRDVLEAFGVKDAAHWQARIEEEHRAFGTYDLHCPSSRGNEHRKEEDNVSPQEKRSLMAAPLVASTRSTRNGDRARTTEEALRSASHQRQPASRRVVPCNSVGYQYDAHRRGKPNPWPLSQRSGDAAEVL